jgi:hypothetical protein
LPGVFAESGPTEIIQFGRIETVIALPALSQVVQQDRSNLLLLANLADAPEHRALDEQVSSIGSGHRQVARVDEESRVSACL